MTNSKTIIPFCCDMSGASEQEIRDLHKMCIEAGAVGYDSAEEWVTHKDRAPYMGVDNDNDTLSLSSVIDEFNFCTITLEEVSSHLGLTLPEDKTLVEGTLSHAYETLKGDIGNVLNYNGEVLFFYSGCSNYEKGYYTSIPPIQNSLSTEVCTVKQFNEYCTQQSLISTQGSVTPPVTGFTTKPKQSHTEGVKHPVWTSECLLQGISFQDGMLVNVNVKEHGFKGKGIVMCHTEKMVIVEIDGVEEAVHIDCISPYEEVVVSLRDKVIDILVKEWCIGKIEAEDKYDYLLRLGVLKEDE